MAENQNQNTSELKSFFNSPLCSAGGLLSGRQEDLGSEGNIFQGFADYVGELYDQKSLNAEHLNTAGLLAYFRKNQVYSEEKINKTAGLFRDLKQKGQITEEPNNPAKNTLFSFAKALDQLGIFNDFALATSNYERIFANFQKKELATTGSIAVSGSASSSTAVRASEDAKSEAVSGSVSGSTTVPASEDAKSEPKSGSASGSTTVPASEDSKPDPQADSATATPSAQTAGDKASSAQQKASSGTLEALKESASDSDKPEIDTSSVTEALPARAETLSDQTKIDTERPLNPETATTKGESESPINPEKQPGSGHYALPKSQNATIPGEKAPVGLSGPLATPVILKTIEAPSPGPNLDRLKLIPTPLRGRKIAKIKLSAAPIPSAQSNFSSHGQVGKIRSGRIKSNGPVRQKDSKTKGRIDEASLQQLQPQIQPAEGLRNQGAISLTSSKGKKKKTLAGKLVKLSAAGAALIGGATATTGKAAATFVINADQIEIIQRIINLLS